MILAVDFDGTIVDFDFPRIGKERQDAVRALKQLQGEGHKIIIWTCRTGSYLTDALEWLKARGFTPDGANEHLVKWEGPNGNGPKIFADMYIDDMSFPPFPGWENLINSICGGWKN